MAISGWLMVGEWQASGYSAKDDLAMLARGHTPVLALSASSDTALLDGCLRAGSSVEGRVLPTEQRRALLAQCLRLGEAITSTSRHDAYAWFVLAYFLAETGQLAAFNTALARSYQTGPNEQWIAALRVRVAEWNLADLDDVTRQGHKADIALMVQSPRGREAIAQRYIADADFRERLKNMVATLPVQDQKIFIATLRGIARDAANG